MPLMYFQDTDHATQLAHLRAIIAAKASGRPLELTLKGEDNAQWTFVRPLNYPGVLAELVKELPRDLPLRAAKIHTAKDGQLVIDTFEFGQGEPFDPHDPDQALKLEQTMGYAAMNLPQWSADGVRDYFHRCTADYVLTVAPAHVQPLGALPAGDRDRWDRGPARTGERSDSVANRGCGRQRDDAHHAGARGHTAQPLIHQRSSRLS
jgi:hypothetical protein